MTGTIAFTLVGMLVFWDIYKLLGFIIEQGVESFFNAVTD